MTLKATFVQTRKANCDSMEDKIKKVVGPWKGGKFMYVTQRGYSANCYAFSKIFHRCASIPLREDTIACITSQLRSWVLQDFFKKPAAAALHRKPLEGGLGLYCVKLRALALLLRTFCELACIPGFRHRFSSQPPPGSIIQDSGTWRNLACCSSSHPLLQ